MLDDMFQHFIGKFYGVQELPGDILLVTFQVHFEERDEHKRKREYKTHDTKNDKNISSYDFSLLVVSLYFYKVAPGTI